jgi:hypothetical protein
VLQLVPVAVDVLEQQPQQLQVRLQISNMGTDTRIQALGK